MNKKQKKEPFSLKNMNGLSHDDARTCAALAEAGAGCALIPASALPDPQEGMFALRADCEALFSRIDVVWDENAYRSASALRFVEWIRQNAKLA